MSKLSDFLEKEKVDPRRIVVASRKLERPRDEDRAIRLARVKVDKGADNESLKELAGKKPRTGRPLTLPTVNKALAGKPLGRRTRQRFVRAVNEVLKQKNKSTEVTASDLF